MKPPDRPTPGRTDRILGVMGGMLRACAVPGQEGVRRRDRGWGRGSLEDFKRIALHDSVYPQTKVMEQSQGSVNSAMRAVGQVLVDPFKIMCILTGGKEERGGRGSLGKGPYSDSVSAAPGERPLRAWEYQGRE